MLAKKSVYYLNNTGGRWIVTDDHGRREARQFTTDKGETITRRVIFYEAFGSFATACISWRGKKISVFLDSILCTQ